MAAGRLGRRDLLLLAAWAGGGALAGCRSERADGSGEARAAAAKADAGGPARLVSLAPSTTEAVFAIGAGPALVARSNACDFPPEARALPHVGGFANPSLEAIVALAPSLVVGAHGPAGRAVADRLAEAGIATYFPRTESYDEIVAMVRGLGERVGRAREAGEVAAGLERARAEVSAKAAGKKRVRALYVFDTSPVVSAGPGSYVAELLGLAGGDNAVARGGAYPTLGLEQLAALDPDVLLDGSGSGVAPLGTGREREGFRELRAVREGRVVVVGDAVLRPGPRVGEGLRELFAALHGG